MTAFELLRFEAGPATGAVAVVELDGRFDGPPPPRCRLLVERGGHGVEVPAVLAAGSDPWRASFAVALDDLADERTEFSLAPGRGPLIALPAPERLGRVEERYIELARQVNELRHRLREADRAAAGQGEREAREELAAERELRRAAEDELRVARRDVREARARLESALREQRGPAPVRRGHEITDETAATAVAPETPTTATDDAPTAVAEPPPAPAPAPARRTRVVRIADAPDEEILEPAAVGARYIEPAETTGRTLTPARIVVALALVALAVALALIVAGVL